MQASGHPPFLRSLIDVVVGPVGVHIISEKRFAVKARVWSPAAELQTKHGVETVVRMRECCRRDAWFGHVLDPEVFALVLLPNLI